MSFREIEKEHLQVLAPPEIVSILRDKAARERTSISAATTELLCQALEIDPGKFGIETTQPANTTADTPDPDTMPDDDLTFAELCRFVGASPVTVKKRLREMRIKPNRIVGSAKLYTKDAAKLVRVRHISHGGRWPTVIR